MQESLSRQPRELADFRLNVRPFSGFSSGWTPNSEAEGYLVQELLHQTLVGRKGQVIGHKIGCTTVVMQQFLKIDSPCAGGVFENTAAKH